MKALKAIMKVKKGTTNDLIYHELRRCTIVSRIKDRQHAFFKKMTQFTTEEAVLTSIIQLCNNSNIIRYYTNLQEDNVKRDIQQRERRIHDSNNSMCEYYVNMNFVQKSCIYTSMANDFYRYIVTRWRLSNHDLEIETGWYAKPKLPREMRVCTLCHTMEDEHHVVFVCPRYNSIRDNHRELVLCNNISRFLDPELCTIKETACFLHETEKMRKEID